MISRSPSTFLFDLSPIGVGSFEVESLSSYISRLAYIHTLTPYQLLSTLDAWSREKRGEFVPRFFSARVNGYSSNVRRLVGALEVATGRDDIGACTLLHLRDVCARNNSDSIKINRSWCKACLRESIEREQIPYDRLIWQIVGTARCSVHKCHLDECCPGCGTKQHWQYSSTPSNCVFCGHTLAGHPHNARPLPPDPGERHFVELMSYISSVEPRRFRTDAAGTFLKAISEHTDLKTAARRLGGVLRKAEHARPSLCSLLYISEYFDISSTLILTDPEEASNVAGLAVGTPKIPRRYRGAYLPRGARKAAIERALQREIDSDGLAPTIRRFCEDNDFCETTVSQWGRELLQQLVSKRALQLKSIRDEQVALVDKMLGNRESLRAAQSVREYLKSLSRKARCPLWLVRQRYIALKGGTSRRIRSGMLYMDIDETQHDD